MKNYYETLSNLFDAITSKKEGKPDAYAYVLHQGEIKRDGNGDIIQVTENGDGNAHILSDLEYTTAFDVYIFECWEFYKHEGDNREIKFTGEKYSLFEMTNEMLSELEKVESLNMLTDDTNYHFIPKGSYDVDGQQFYEYKDFLFAISEDEKIFFGKFTDKLKEYTLNESDFDDDNDDDE